MNIFAALLVSSLLITPNGHAASTKAGCNATQDRITLPGTPWSATSAGSVAWVITRDGQRGTVVRVDTSAHRVTASYPMPFAPWGVAYAFGSVWVSGEDGHRGATLIRLNAQTGRVEARIHEAAFGVSIAATTDRIWVQGNDSAPRRVFAIDPSRNQVVASVNLGRQTAFSLAARGRHLWTAGYRGISDVTDAQVAHKTAIDPARAAGLSFGVAFLDDTVWVARAGAYAGTPSGHGALVPVAAASGKVNGERIPLAVAPTAIAAAAGYLWVATTAFGAPAGVGPSVLRIDPKTHKTATVHLPGEPTGFVVVRGRPWVLIKGTPSLVPIC